MSIRTQMLKGILDACIMKIVEEEPVYGYELAQKLHKSGLDDISDGTIYPVLLRLQKNGLIVSESRPSPSGPNRKYYQLTDEGKKELTAITKVWFSLKSPVTRLLEEGETNDESRELDTTK